MIKNIMSKGIIVITIMAVFVFTPGLLSGASIVSADSSDPEKPSSNEVRGIRPVVLERLYKRAEKMYLNQEKLLENVEDGNPKIQEFIDKQKEDGKDTTALEEALEVYQEAVLEAKEFHESAGETLGTHQGFDDDGQVTDIVQAKETIRSVMEDLKEFNKAVRESFQAVREAMKENRPKPDND